MKCLQSKNITMKLKPSPLLNKSLCICPLTFITEMLCLVAIAMASTVLTSFLCHALMTCWATPIKFIDSKCDTKFNPSHRVYITPYHATGY